jgi:type I restriction enzyme S subunit
MKNNWDEIIVDDLKDSSTHSIGMGPSGINIKTENYVPSGVPVVRGLNLNANRFLDEGFVYLTDEKANELRNANVYPNDLIFSHRGTLGQVGIIPHNARYNRYVISSSQMKLRCDPKIADPLFVFYYFKSQQGQHALLANKSTTSVRAISSPLTTLRTIRIPLPPLPEQRAISGTLGALDDKLELNHRMNHTLESIARTVFRQRFMKSEEVKGWKVGKLGDVADNIRRSVKVDKIDSETYHIGLGQMPRGSIALSEWGNASKLAWYKNIFKEGEILFGRLRPYYHKVGIAPIDGVCSVDILVIVPKAPVWYGFVLGHVSSVELIKYADAVSAGTKMPRTNWSDIANYKVKIPSVRLAREFNELFMPMAKIIRSNIMQSRALANLRDTLLPKLISGEVTVKT